MLDLAATAVVAVLALCIVHGLTRSAIAFHRTGRAHD